jgi:Competence protein J (ComJ)
MPAVHRQSLEVFADYHQFYVQDGGINPPAPEEWTDEDIENRCKTAENVVVVCPLRNMTVPVELVVHDSAPPAHSSAPDHAVECSLALPTGHLQLHECTGGQVLNLQVPPGNYRVRLTYRGLDSISKSGLEGNDSYEIELWPGAERALHVTHRWSAPNEA